ncbi:MAG: radical SAM protein [Pirellulaceae bacterium]|nr:radical SAM protein [Planctomycetales bacterium]
MTTSDLHAHHPRWFDHNRFVYPVLSRRSQGISVGVNLNPDKVCNFDCIYCQIDRTSTSETRFVAIDALINELSRTLQLVASSELYRHSPFDRVPSELKRLNDIAFSGDGEPTTFRNFDEIMSRCAQLKKQLALDDVKMVLITNASMLHRPHVRQGLEVLDQSQGEIWAKLDAGTEEYYQLIERTSIPFRQILQNITQAAIQRPIVIQSLFMRVNGEPIPWAECEAFCDRLNEIQQAGGSISLVQVYTIARRPAESFVAPLADTAVDAIVDLVQQRTQLNTKAFYGVHEDLP